MVATQLNDRQTKPALCALVYHIHLVLCRNLFTTQVKSLFHVVYTPDLGKVTQSILKPLPKIIINQMITIKLIGFSPQQTENFSAILLLAERRLQQPWKIVETMSADFFLVSEKARHETDSCLSLPRDHCLFYSSTKYTEDAQILLTDSHGLPRLRSMIDALNNITAQAAASNATAEVPQDARTEQGFFNLEQQQLLKQLLHTETQQLTAYTLQTPSEQVIIYTYPPKNIYYCALDLTQLDAYFTVQVVSIQTLNETVWRECISTLSPKSLRNLIWYITFKTSQGKLLQGHADTDIVCLNNWPDLGLAPCRNYMKLIAFMRHNAVPIAEIAANTQVCLQEVYNFYNACYLVGFIDKKNSIEWCRKQHHQRDLLDKINGRLKEINAQKEKGV